VPPLLPEGGEILKCEEAKNLLLREGGIPEHQRGGGGRSLFAPFLQNLNALNVTLEYGIWI
jgi:hypothetical protein